MSLDQDRQRLLDDISNGRAHVESSAKRYRRLHTGIAVSSIILGLLATALAADSARGSKVLAGPVVTAVTGGPAPGDLARGWRVVCGVIAVCTFLGTAATAVDKTLKISEHRTKAMICAGKLDSLETQMSTTMTRAELERYLQEYTGAKREYPEYFR